jgi:hypothetical protein
LLGGTLLIVRAWSAFSDETLVAQATTARLSPTEFELTYMPAGAGPEAHRRFRLRGDQWAVSGGIVKWHPWLTALGLKSYHKPLRVSGQFADIRRQRAQPPTVELLEPAMDRFWETLYWADAYLPFIEAVYGSAAYVYVEPGIIQALYVTPSGYLIKRASR